jgi:hypothetical protein
LFFWFWPLLLSERSGRKKMMKTAIRGNAIPIKNHLIKDLPILRAKRPVLMGKPKRSNKKRIDKKITLIDVQS